MKNVIDSLLTITRLNPSIRLLTGAPVNLDDMLRTAGVSLNNMIYDIKMRDYKAEIRRAKNRLRYATRKGNTVKAEQERALIERLEKAGYIKGSTVRQMEAALLDYYMASDRTKIRLEGSKEERRYLLVAMARIEKVTRFSPSVEPMIIKLLVSRLAGGTDVHLSHVSRALFTGGYTVGIIALDEAIEKIKATGWRPCKSLEQSDILESVYAYNILASMAEQASLKDEAERLASIKA